jgi:enterochelin esterase-like enzyme
MPMNGQIYYHPNPNAKFNKTHRTNVVQARCVVYSPPGYEGEKGGSCPVLYLLHGVGDIEYSWELHGKASAIVDGLLEDGSIAPMFAVMPFGFESNEQKYRREFPSKRWFDGYMARVIDEVERAYKLQVPTTANTRSPKRAIAGLSMGGKQALEFGLDHLELFSAIGNFSGAIQMRSDTDPLPGLIEVCKAKRAQIKSLALFYHACGRDDEVGKETDHALIDANRRLVGELNSMAISHRWQEMEGKHEWAVWRACLKEFLILLAKEW